MALHVFLRQKGLGADFAVEFAVVAMHLVHVTVGHVFGLELGLAEEARELLFRVNLCQVDLSD